MSDSDVQFKNVCNLLLHHAVGADTGEDTLNRLLRKHLRAHRPDLDQDLPRLSTRNVAVARESWSKISLSDLAPERIRNRRPDDADAPLIVVRFRDQDLLIDGGSRISQWRQESLKGTHEVFVVSVMDEAPN